MNKKNDIMARICIYIPKEDQKTVKEMLKELIEKAQNEGLVEGYEYAVRLLQESLIKGDKE